MQGKRTMKAPAPTRIGVKLNGLPGGGLTASLTMTVWYCVGRGFALKSLPPSVLKKRAVLSKLFFSCRPTTPTTDTFRALRECMRERRRGKEFIFSYSRVAEAIDITNKHFLKHLMCISAEVSRSFSPLHHPWVPYL